MRRAMNACLLDAYLKDCHRALNKWNALLEQAGLPERLFLPSTRFNRHLGVFAGQTFDLEGNPVTQDEFDAGIREWLPAAEDYKLVGESMVAVYEPGKMANWIAPPQRGVGGKPLDFEYVQFH